MHTVASSNMLNKAPTTEHVGCSLHFDTPHHLSLCVGAPYCGLVMLQLLPGCCQAQRLAFHFPCQVRQLRCAGQGSRWQDECDESDASSSLSHL